jgi:hypothetical protein
VTSLWNFSDALSAAFCFAVTFPFTWSVINYSTPPDTGKPDYGRKYTKSFLIITNSAPKSENNHKPVLHRGI